jgi:hypothetical protein
MKPQQWHSALRSYVLIVAWLNFIWEIIQLPFYTLWRTATPKTIAFAVIHCTAGDVVIAITALVSSLLIFGSNDWPERRRISISILTIITGVTYTVYSERSNIASGAWAYSEVMPIIPWLDIGLTPILQWLIIPGYYFWKIEKQTSVIS